MSTAPGLCAAGATVIAVHWRSEADEHVRAGDGVPRALGEVPWLSRTCRHLEDEPALETFTVEQPWAALGKRP